jgi:hypothetical protein
LNWTHTFSPTFLVETTLTASRDQVFILMTFDNPGFSRATYGINYPFIFSAATEDRPDKIPTVAIQGSPFQEITGAPSSRDATGPQSRVADMTRILRSFLRLRRMSRQSASALESVVTAVRIMEDDPLFTPGPVRPHD